MSDEIERADHKGSDTESIASIKQHSADALARFDPADVKRAWLKVDLHIMPIAVLLYLASYIDRANIGNAKVLGLSKALHLTPNQYNLALSIFFVGYVVFETPSNIILKRIGPRWYIPVMTIVWGIVCGLLSLVTDHKGLTVARFFLGATEAGFLPGIVYWVGSWYPREKQGRRYAILYSSVSLTGAFGGLLATAIHALNGVHGIAGWRWIFIVEGCITAGFGLLALIFMTTYPARAHFLTPTEREIILLSNEADRALKAREHFSKSQIRSAFTDWRVYLWGLIYLTTYIPVYSVILSLPSVITGLGYHGTTATLMACPPYGLGFIAVLTIGFTTDKYGRRFEHYVGGILVAMISLIVLMTVKSNGVRYGAFFFMMFMFVPIAVIWSWLSANVAGANKRAAATGFIFSMGNIGGAISGQIYRAEWAPRYVQGHGINLACYSIALVAGYTLWRSYRNDNLSRDAVAAADEKAHILRGDMLGEDLGELGDRHPHFRYYL
ncbi:MFS general substrate transporter [Auriscalpium vulgare]|uniref:MFS general substrate transporter n=1 Tax=Auriscalpium vulgare TaxID=40419 RepID=A0ACB8R6G9_9AGAM|nr:MFS general substrate transporter [Auriscalpium vulgare]